MTEPGAPPRGRLVGSASVLALGNVVSRLLGLVREQVIAAGWGGSLEASAFAAAARVPTLLYDLLVGGMLSAALVPVMSAYEARDRAEFWRAAGVLLSVGAAICGVAAGLVFVTAPWLAQLLGRGYGPEGIALVEKMLRIIAPSVLAFGVAGVLMGFLYALERFTLAAVNGAVYNLGFIVTAVALEDRLGVYALPLGVTLGAVAQVALLTPGLARGGALRPGWRHPAVRRVGLLYIPVAAGLLVSLVQGFVEPGLASAWGDAALAWMRYATTLIQTPQGLIVVAISAAILPRLSANHARAEAGEYADTLARGLRAVAALMIPAAIGLAVLAVPLTGLIFQRGAFGDVDRIAVSLAVVGYAVGLPFAAIDWPLNYAFYARQNTVVPAVVGVVSVALWFGVALLLPRWLGARWGPEYGFLGLVLADSAKHVTHATIMLVLGWRVTGGRGLAGLGRTVVAATAAGLAMAVAVGMVDWALASVAGEGALAWGLRVLVGVTVGVVTYSATAHALGVGELGWVWRQVRAHFA